MLLVRLLLWILSHTASLWIAATLLPSLTITGQPEEWIIAGAIFGAVNSIIRPLLKLIAGPFIIVTFGLALIVVQSIVLWITRIGVETFTNALFVIDVPWGYLWGSIIVGLTTLLFQAMRGNITAPPANETFLEHEEDLEEELRGIREDLQAIREKQHDDYDE